MSRDSGVPIIARAHRHTERTAVVDPQGSFSYNNLLNASSDVATALLAGREDLHAGVYKLEPGEGDAIWVLGEVV